MRQLLFIAFLAFTTSCTHTAITPDATQNVSVQNKPFVVRPLDTEDINPYGVVFDVEPLNDVDVPKVGKVAAYGFVGRNFSPDQTVVLASQHINGTLKPLYEYMVDDDGTLGRQIADGMMMLENEVILMFDFFRGQPIRYWLYTKDGKVRVSRLVVPYPIQTTGKDGATISIRRITPDAKLALCEGYDFLPDELVLVSTQTGKDLIANIPISCPNGKFSIALEPGLSGKTGGKAYVEVKRTTERLLLEYSWGCEAVHTKSVIAPSRYVDQDTLQKLSLESSR